MNYSGNPRYATNNLLNLTFNFSKSIIRFSIDLRSQKEFEISKQLIKSGTSIGANIREAQNAESTLDFIHKLKIALKEADETEYWLLLILDLWQEPETQKLLNQLEEILKILNKSISTLSKKIN